MKSFVRAFVVAVGAGAIASCGGGSTAPTSDACTSATFCATASLTFTPTSATRGKGANIVWGNNSTFKHNVTFDNPTAAQTAGLTGGNIAAGDLLIQPANIAGTYAFHCAIHPQMTGTLTIQ